MPLSAVLAIAAAVSLVAAAAFILTVRRGPAVRWTSAAFFLLLGAMSCYCAVEA